MSKKILKTMKEYDKKYQKDNKLYKLVYGKDKDKPYAPDYFEFETNPIILFFYKLKRLFYLPTKIISKLKILLIKSYTIDQIKDNLKRNKSFNIRAGYCPINVTVVDDENNIIPKVYFCKILNGKILYVKKFKLDNKGKCIIKNNALETERIYNKNNKFKLNLEEIIS